MDAERPARPAGFCGVSLFTNAPGFQQPHNLFVAITVRPHHRTASGIICYGRNRLSIQQDLNHGKMSAAGRRNQGRRALPVFRIQPGTCISEHFGNLHIAVLSGIVERGIALMVAAVDGDLVTKKNFNNRIHPLLRRLDQCRFSLPVTKVRLGAVMKKLIDLLRILRLYRNKKREICKEFNRICGDWLESHQGTKDHCRDSPPAISQCQKQKFKSHFNPAFIARPVPDSPARVRA